MGAAEKGSQAALQRLVEEAPGVLQPQALPALSWLSPLRADNGAEYRDSAALEVLGLGVHRAVLRGFWPVRGPVWDGPARAGETVVLVAAKAHARELLTSPSAATDPGSVARIGAAFATVRQALGADDRSDWARAFYQYANRLAFLWWLRSRGVDARLLFVSVLNDAEMGGPARAETWVALFSAADHALGLPARHALSPIVHHVYPDLAA
jgi:hypothetical protein